MTNDTSVVQMKCSAEDSPTTAQAARNSSTQRSSVSSAADGNSRCTALDHINSTATLAVSATRRNSFGLTSSTHGSDCNSPKGGLCSNAKEDIEACRNASGNATAVTNTEAAMINHQGDWTRPVNSIIRSHRPEAGPALPELVTSQHDGLQEEVMLRSSIYKKLLWQMIAGHEAESLIVSDVYLGRLQLEEKTGQLLHYPDQHCRSCPVA